MSDETDPALIRLRGVRQNNLKNFNLDLPAHRLIVVTGLSGSGKSSLAFDTLYAEGQRRYIETFSPYARQFFDRMDKPQVDSIQGIPPAIAIEQRNAVKTTRSTVGTMTEITDYMKVVWSHLAQLYCRQCGRLVRKDSPQTIWQTLTHAAPLPGEFPERAGVAPGSATDEVLITFDLPLTEKLSLEESLELIQRQGYQRLLVAKDSVRAGVDEPSALREAMHPWPQPPAIEPEMILLRADEAAAKLDDRKLSALTVVQDRVKLIPANRARFVEACEQAYHFGKGKLTIRSVSGRSAAKAGSAPAVWHFSNRYHCAACDLEYREPASALFSFNHPLGACPTCRGFGRTITIDYQLAIPDRSLSLAGGAIKPWQTGQGMECQQDLLRMCRETGIRTNVPFEKLSEAHQRWVIEGDPDYGKDEEHEWPRSWYGVKGYFRWLESRAYKMHVRVLLSRYRAYQTCPMCQGQRLQPDALLFKIPVPSAVSNPNTTAPNRIDAGANPRALASPAREALTLADFYLLPIDAALDFVDQLAAKRPNQASDPVLLVLNEVRSRLRYLVEVGLGYLTLDRPTRSLSGGETERVNLTTCLGTRLVNTLYVLDEPSVGLHPRDTERLVRVLEQLRSSGNTVVVVEHEASVIRAADQIVDLGPGHGEGGGALVFQGTFEDLLESDSSLTGQYLSGRKRIEIPKRRPPPPRVPGRREHPAWLKISGATLHNLKNLAVEIPLGRFVCVSGVSGSGKTTLIREILWPALHRKLKSQPARHPFSILGKIEEPEKNQDEEPEDAIVPGVEITGWGSLSRVLLVDQSALGRTPRSNPAVYIGAFDDLRDLFAQSDAALQRGLNASAFSFNSSQGQCERCRGAGFEKIEMQFLSDVFIRCPDCNGRRYRPHILEVKIAPPSARSGAAPSASDSSSRPGEIEPSAWSIADLLDATVDEAIAFLKCFDESRMAGRAAAKLQWLQDVGLGYLRLGQPINTLSGGESQRLKLVGHLAEFQQWHRAGQKPVLFLFDEPTTGLHFDDVRVLLQVFQRLVDAGHTVLVIEHNLDVIKSADWVIDLGPEAGARGGEIVAQGRPEEVAACVSSHTGLALRTVLS